MHDLERLYLIAAWSYILAFNLTIRCSPDRIHLFHTTPQLSASKRWQTRQSSDPFTRAAKVSGLKSRAAFKLLQINDRYRLFKPGQTVVDLGFAPGSWSQVAVDLTKPGGRVLGVDLIPAQPPRGVSTIQGDFLSPEVQAQVRAFVRDPERGRLRRPLMLPVEDEGTGISEEIIKETSGHGYVDSERESVSSSGEEEGQTEGHEEQCVDVVLSDMCEPWDLIEGRHKRSISNPYYRMMNTSGNAFRDHAGSMDLSLSALLFAYQTLKPGGHFVCKFYAGAEDKALERKLKALFLKVHREKPESSRSDSKENYFVGIKRLARVDGGKIFDE